MNNVLELIHVKRKFVQGDVTIEVLRGVDLVGRPQFPRENILVAVFLDFDVAEHPDVAGIRVMVEAQSEELAQRITEHQRLKRQFKRKAYSTNCDARVKINLTFTK